MKPLHFSHVDGMQLDYHTNLSLIYQYKQHLHLNHISSLA